MIWSLGTNDHEPVSDSRGKPAKSQLLSGPPLIPGPYLAINVYKDRLADPPVGPDCLKARNGVNLDYPSPSIWVAAVIP